jgi:undecaprenyl-diphosphatase
VAFPESIQAIDEAILRQAVGSPEWAVPLFFTLTLIGGGWGLLLILPFVIRKTTRVAGLCMLIGVLVTSGLVTLLKMLFERARPCDALGWCAPVAVLSPGGYSFPSGHAAGSFAFAAFVAMRVPKLGPPALLCAALIAWSRCMLGVHYPSDVLAGSLFGGTLGVASAMISVALEKRVLAKTSPDARPIREKSSERQGAAEADPM